MLLRNAVLYPFTLRFRSDSLESSYVSDYAERSLKLLRLALWLGAIQFLLFGLLDHLMVPHVLYEVWAVRAFVCLSIICFIGWTHMRHFKKRMQLWTSTVPLLAAAGVVAMIIIAQDSEGYYDYYAGMMLILFYVHVLLRLRFIFATAVSWIIIGAYILVAREVVATPSPLLINSTFFLLSANTCGMVASYALEYYDRIVFARTRDGAEQKRLLEIEYERKTQELDDTRKLQLSMLPGALPDHASADLAVYMTTAAEVGGDYYDFHVSEDGTLTFAIGDATGHGARAGAMVTATKVLFTSLADEDDVLKMLKKASMSLKRAGFSRMYMALAVGKLRGHRLELAGAGMPPALIHRVQSGAIEQVPLKGMPLGSFVDFDYQKSVLYLNPGDTVLFMSDGFPELFNGDRKMIGYEEAVSIFRAVARDNPDRIIETFGKTVQSWAANGSQNDDVTFIVMRMKEQEPATTNGRTKSGQLHSPID